MANRYLRDLTPWPAGVPVPANAQFIFYDSGTDEDYRIDGERVDGAASGVVAVRVITANPSPPFVLDELGTFVRGGDEGFYRFKAPVGEPYGVPTGPDDANWHQVAPPVPAGSQTVTLPETTFLILAADNGFGTYAGMRLYVNERQNGGTVTVDVLGTGALAYDDAYEFDPANSDAPAAPVTMSIVGGAVVTAPRSGGPWRYLGDAADNNLVRGEAADSNAYGANHEGNTYGSGHTDNTYGAGHFNNTYANRHDHNTFDEDHFNNTYGHEHSQGSYGVGHTSNSYGHSHYHNTYGDRLLHNRFGHVHSENTYGDDVVDCVFGDGCTYLQVGANCERVEVYNCQGTSGSHFVIPAGTTDAVYRNGVRVGPFATLSAVSVVPGGGPAGRATLVTAGQQLANASLTLTFDTTVLVFTGLQDGAQGTLFVTQDSTGGRVLTVIDSVGFVQDAAALVAHAVTEYGWINRGGTCYWRHHTY